MYGPCKTWIAWLVTLPEELATGAAEALTPPTLSARTLCGKKESTFTNATKKYFTD
jgi:hypothetical protein